MSNHIIVIGGGIIGLATAFKLIQKGIANVTLLEKEQLVAQHQSSHNSGVLHAGLYYKPGSLKAKLATSGITQMISYCKDNEINFEQCGKLVIATTEEEIPHLNYLFENGNVNGLTGLQFLNTNEIKYIEPHVEGIQAIHVPEEGIVDYKAVCESLRKQFITLGGRIHFGFKVHRVVKFNGGIELNSIKGKKISADYVINCAGLYSDKIAQSFGLNSDVRIIPFRGEYYHLHKDAQYLVKHLVYPVPDVSYPFLGVHFTRMIGGGIEAGPNAVLAFKREGYHLSDFNFNEFLETLSFSGLRKFLFKHRKMVFKEIASSISKDLFLKRLQKMIPAIQKEHLSKGFAGVRAQAMRSNGDLVQDFEIIQNDTSLHLINAPSPGATASLAIADYILSQIKSEI